MRQGCSTGPPLLPLGVGERVAGGVGDRCFNQFLMTPTSNIQKFTNTHDLHDLDGQGWDGMGWDEMEWDGSINRYIYTR